MKRFIGTALALIILGGLGWAGGYLYWHIRLIGALRTLETRTGPQGSDADAVEIVRDTGCRGLPYLVGALQPNKNPYFLALASDLLRQGLQGPISRGNLEIERRLSEWRITAETRGEERQKKCDDLHFWWREEGESHHSGAKWWRTDCGGI